MLIYLTVYLNVNMYSSVAMEEVSYTVLQLYFNKQNLITCSIACLYTLKPDI